MQMVYNHLNFLSWLKNKKTKKNKNKCFKDILEISVKFNGLYS